MPLEGGAWPTVPTEMPATMRAVVFHQFGAPEVLEGDTVPLPAPSRQEVLVRVGAVSVGRLLDLATRAGTHPHARFRLPHILGAEHAGTVVGCGDGVDDVEIGDRVAVFPVFSCGSCAACRVGESEACPMLEICGVHRRGAYAEYTVVPASNVRVVPAGMGPVEAAGLALAGAVAQNQLDRAGLQPGQWVLVQGAASALGSLTAALARYRGGRVIGTSRSQDKRGRLLEIGLESALDPLDDDFVNKVLELTGERGVHIAVDNLGEPRVWAHTLDSLATRGTVVSSGAFLGRKVEIDLMQVYSRCQRVLGVRTGNLTSVAGFWRAVEDGFRPVIDQTFPVSRAADAHRYLEPASNFGRVVLTVGAETDWST